MEMFSENQKKVLELLLTQYENSRTYVGRNKITQHFQIPPGKVFKSYDSDYADLDLIHDFENQMEELRKAGLISIKQRNGIMEKLVANPEKWQDYYKILNRQDKDTRTSIQVKMYQDYLGVDPLLDRFCEEQMGRLRSNKNAFYGMETAEDVLKLCRFILKNQEDILERELSIAVLGDSKLFAEKYRSRICNLLRKYGDFEDLLLGISNTEDKEDKREMERVLLAEHRVYANPSYVYLKGNGEIVFDNGQRLQLNLYMPMALSTETLKRLESIRIRDNHVMTVENLTSFNRLERKNTFMIFLSGYHNSAKQKLIRKIYDTNPGLTWHHFGDIDPDGFYIMENLRRGTGIDFQPVYMDVETLKQYRIYTKPLTGNDRQKAEALACSNRYGEIMNYMLEAGVKLEQEIVSWMDSGCTRQ